MTVILAIGGLILAIMLSWPWVDPYLLRHDATARILRVLEDEWNREDDPPRFDERPWQ